MEKEGMNLELPDGFLEFLKENELDPSIYSLGTASTPRYIRLKPGCESYVEEIESGLKCKLHKVNWLPHFYSLPNDIQIASSTVYRDGKIYGVDAASGAAVLALGVTQGDHVLDLCAAPGAKLCMILDLLGNSGSVTAVDVARHRLAACRTMLQKYSLGDRCRLFVADGSTFSLVPTRIHSDSASLEPVGEFMMEEMVEKFKEWASRRSFKERKSAAKARKDASLGLLHAIQYPELIYYGRHSGVVGLTKRELYQMMNESDALNCGYDKVLVDAECTHDGSIKHIQKFEHWGWKTLQRRVLDAERTDNLTILQLRLLSNGFRLLKVGGSLVYSTCSLTVAQNEDVVEKFLHENACAVLQTIDDAKNWPCQAGKIPKTLRFDPLTSETSGLFVSKFTKLSI